MSDRHIGYVVVLDTALRDDDSAEIIKAIRLLRGVVSVQPVVRDPHDMINRSQAVHELKQKLWKALEEE